MITTSQNYKDAISATNRHFTFTVTPATGTFPISQVVSIKIAKRGASEQRLMPGEFCKSQCKMQTTAPLLGTFTITFKVSGASDVINLGKYWVNSCEYDDGKKQYTVTAYDTPPWFDTTCNTGNRTVSAILSEMQTKSGMGIRNRNLITLSSISEIEEDITWSELLAQLAGQQGYSVRTNAGDLEIYKYETVNYTIPARRIYATGLKLNNSSTTIGYYLVNEEFSTGSGSYGIRYKNPYITSNDQVAAMAFYLNKSYTPMHVRFNGDPALQIGDIITVSGTNGVSKTCYVMDIDITISGGLAMGINCYSNEEVRTVISEKPLDRKLRELRSYTQSSVERIMDVIFKSDSGYYFEIDANGNPITEPDQTPAGFQITDASMTQGWRFILGGLYHSNDGFQSVSNLAISADGQIYGQFLALNSVGTEALEVSAQDAIDGSIAHITYDSDGMHIARKNSAGTIVSNYQSLFTELGMRVTDKQGNVTLSAERDTVDAANLTAENYLRIADEDTGINSRFQGFQNSIHNKFQFGIFWEK
jgi:hypothetical protein